MAQRDYEEQPEAPDLGASVQLEPEESLVAPAGGADPLDAGYVPADRPYALDEDGVTGAGMRDGDTLDERLAREQPDGGSDPDRAGRIIIADEGSALETRDAMDGVDVGIDGGAASAEEAAVHETTDPGGATDFEPAVDGSPLLDDPEVDRSVDEDPGIDRALADAERDAGPLAPGPAAEGSEERLGRHTGLGTGSDRSGQGPDPALPRDPADSDPAARLDRDPETDGASAPVSGRRDAGF